MFTNRLSTIQTKRRSDDEGFTLIELLVVVVILGILIAIAIPTYLSYRKSAADKSAQSDLRNAVTVLEACAVDGGYPTSVNGTTGVMVGCDGQKLQVSKDTELKYSTASGTFIMAAKNNGGSKFYCYNSSVGGSVKEVTAAAYATAAPC